ncbi:MAG TPA: glycosyltransferase family 2 protein [Steroidobacteraceae bacterium]
MSGGVSVLILTLNEEINIAECIDSCGWSDDLVVFDSFSSDRTREIAVTKGARVFQRRFDDYAAQRNAALSTVTYAHPWVLMVDADERVPADLAAEIAAAVRSVNSQVVMFRMRRKDFFLGKWLKRSSGYPTWFGRLVRLGRVRVQREYNEEYIADGDVVHLKAHLHHLPLNKGVDYWYERHNRYSKMEAMLTLNMRSAPISSLNLFGADPIERRRSLRQIAYRMPMRPLMVFLYLYIIRLGILDGRAGFYFSRMRAAYEMMIDLKIMELERREQGLPI